MKRDIHLTAEDILRMVNMEPGMVGKYALVPGPMDRLRSLLNEIEKPLLDFSFMDHEMYTGCYNDIPVTVTNGGRYCPDSAIMTEILCAAGTENIIRIGSCGAMNENYDIGDFIIPTGAIRGDGVTPHYVTENFSTVADYKIINALIEACEKRGKKYHLGLVWSTDALLRETNEVITKMLNLKAVCVDMVSSALLTIAQVKNVRAGAILAVSDNLITGEVGMIAPKFFAAETESIKIALDAVGILHKAG